MTTNPFRPDPTPVAATMHTLRKASTDYTAALGQARDAYIRAQDIASRLDQPVPLPEVDWTDASAAAAVLTRAAAAAPPPAKRHVRYVGPDGTVRTTWCDEQYARKLLRDRQGEVIDDLGPLEPAKPFQRHGSPLYTSGGGPAPSPKSTVRAGQLISGPQ